MPDNLQKSLLLVKLIRDYELFTMNAFSKSWVPKSSFLYSCQLLLLIGLQTTLLTGCSHHRTDSTPRISSPPPESASHTLHQPSPELVAHKLFSGKALQSDYRQTLPLIPSLHQQIEARKDTLSQTDAARLQPLLHPMISWIRQQAVQGNANARLMLGYCTWKGLGVLPDTAQGLEWLQKSSAQGNAMATWQLALLRMELKKPNTSDSIASAARAGIPEACLLYGEINRDGINIPQNYATARRWFEKSATASQPLAQLNMGLMNIYGMGGAQNFDIARQYLTNALAHHKESAYWLARMAIDGYGPVTTPETIHAWLLNSLESQASRESTTLLGYVNARNRDFESAASLFQRNIPLDPLASHNLGTLYFIGLGVAPDYASALLFLETGANYGLLSSMRLAGYLYLNGLGTPTTPERAWHWFYKGATLGDAWSAWATGLLLETGFGVPADLVSAYAWQSVALAWGWTTGAGRRDALAARLDRHALTQGQKLAQKIFNDYNYQRTAPVPYLIHRIQMASEAGKPI